MAPPWFQGQSMRLVAPAATFHSEGVHTSTSKRTLASKHLWQQSRPLRSGTYSRIRRFVERIWPSARGSLAAQADQAEPTAASRHKPDICDRIRLAQQALGWQHLQHEEVSRNETSRWWSQNSPNCSLRSVWLQSARSCQATSFALADAT